MWYFLDLIVPQVKEESCSKFLDSSAAVVRDQFAPGLIAFTWHSESNWFKYKIHANNNTGSGIHVLDRNNMMCVVLVLALLPSSPLWHRTEKPSNSETERHPHAHTPTHTHTDTHILTLKQRNRETQREKEIEKEMTQTHIKVFQHTLFLSGVLAALSVSLAGADWHKTPAHVPLWWNLHGTLTLLRHHHVMIISSSSSSSSWSPLHFC
jgi:hypothetical protein